MDHDDINNSRSSSRFKKYINSVKGSITELKKFNDCPNKLKEEYCQRLLDAIYTGDNKLAIFLIDDLITKKIDVRCDDSVPFHSHVGSWETLCSTLSLACKLGRLIVVKYLLETGEFEDCITLLIRIFVSDPFLYDTFTTFNDPDSLYQSNNIHNIWARYLKENYPEKYDEYEFEPDKLLAGIESYSFLPPTEDFTEVEREKWTSFYRKNRRKIYDDSGHRILKLLELLLSYVKPNRIQELKGINENNKIQPLMERVEEYIADNYGDDWRLQIANGELDATEEELIAECKPELERGYTKEIKMRELIIKRIHELESIGMDEPTLIFSDKSAGKRRKTYRKKNIKNKKSKTKKLKKPNKTKKTIK
jgi:hypothetical protein